MSFLDVRPYDSDSSEDLNHEKILDNEVALPKHRKKNNELTHANISNDCNSIVYNVSLVSLSVYFSNTSCKYSQKSLFFLAFPLFLLCSLFPMALAYFLYFEGFNLESGYNILNTIPSTKMFYKLRNICWAGYSILLYGRLMREINILILFNNKFSSLMRKILCLLSLLIQLISLVSLYFTSFRTIGFSPNSANQIGIVIIFFINVVLLYLDQKLLIVILEFFEHIFGNFGLTDDYLKYLSSRSNGLSPNLLHKSRSIFIDIVLTAIYFIGTGYLMYLLNSNFN